MDNQHKEIIDTSINNVDAILGQLQTKLEIYNSELDLLDYGVYTPVFDYASPEEYKAALVKSSGKTKAINC